MMRSFSFVAAIVAFAGSASADVVTQWQSVYQDAIRLTGGAPCPVSRGGPMMSLAMFDAINSIDAVVDYNSSFQPFTPGLPVPLAGTSREAAAATAAYETLFPLYGSNPACAALINNAYAASLAAIPDGAAKAAGIAHGQSVASSILAFRAGDGYDADPSYTYGTNPGDFQLTPDGPNVPAFSPHWGNVTPWGLNTGSQFRPTTLTDFGSMDNLMHSQAYADQINGAPGIPGVKELGSRTSATRTADQTEIAWFWANDRDGTSKPPGQLVEISKIVSNQEGLSLSSNARMFALVNMAMADACVAAWDAKYNTPIDLWRPINAIRETDGAGNPMPDGNPSTIPDSEWLPLNDFTPPFPAYVSGHGTMGAAHAGIMAALFGDNYSFDLGSDEFSVNPGLGYPADLTRHFNSFSEAAWENALSRIYLGVHYYWDALDANILGYQVANYVFENNLRPVPAPGMLALLIPGAALAARRRRA
ncbi:MAG: vanadium-dependent haloperoxidase [Phycisphaerae bacterium]|nr:vanadium-dependent haloperoxidase [Phycisphaerae bacterium]